MLLEKKTIPLTVLTGSKLKHIALGLGGVCPPKQSGKELLEGGIRILATLGAMSVLANGICNVTARTGPVQQLKQIVRQHIAMTSTPKPRLSEPSTQINHMKGSMTYAAMFSSGQVIGQCEDTPIAL